MLDGRCDDHAQAVRAQPIGDGAAAYARQTADHVWLCFAVPDGSYASLDLRIETPALARPLNLHASAQLGEWAADEPGAAPANGSSESWWKGVDGWWASTTPFNGSIATPEGRRTNFRTVRGREVQLSKRRFGLGLWKVSAVISDVAVPGGGRVSVKWPASGQAVLTVGSGAGALIDEAPATR